VTVYWFIAAETANHSILMMCRLLGVSNFGFHAWQHRVPCERQLTDA
jgi:hypothetical protein